MFERQLGLRENPFLAGHHPKFVYPSREHQEALAHLRYGIQNREPFVLITGEVGTGKTTAVYDALGEWGSRALVALITNSALTRSELLEEICLRFGVAAPGPLSKPQALVQLERLLSAVSARGELAILLLDEAQNLDRELLEEIRLLSNLEVQGEKLLQIFLVGQPELESKLAQPELRQLRQRIGIHYRILPLSSGETANYIHHRVAVAGGNAHEMFPVETCLEVFRITNGIPREINIVAGQALLNAFVEDSRAVSPEHVRSVEREIEFQSVLRDHSQLGRAAAPAPPASPLPRHEETAAPAPRPATPEPARAMPPVTFTPVQPAAPERAPEPVTWEPVHEPAASAAPPPTRMSVAPAQSAPLDDSNAPILPSWFDEVVERRRREDQGPTPLAAATPAPHAFVPAYAPPTLVPAQPSAPVEEIRVQASEAAPMESQPPQPSPIDFLTARLREKLMEAEAPPPKKKVNVGWLVPATVIAVVAIGAIMMVFFGPWRLERRSPAPAPAATAITPPAPASVPAQPPEVSTAQSQPVVSSISTPTGAGTKAPAKPVVKSPAPVTAAPVDKAPAPVVAASRPKPVPVAGAAVAGAAGTAGMASATPTRPPVARKPVPGTGAFGIAVGTYLDEGRAIEERTTLTESTKLPAQVVTISEDTVSMYRVVMGSFENRISAERMASDLIRRGLVNEARVVSVARATPPPP